MSVVIACTVSKKHNLAFVYPVSLCVLILGLIAPSSLQYSQKIAPHSCRYYSANRWRHCNSYCILPLVTRAGNSALQQLNINKISNIIYFLALVSTS